MRGTGLIGSIARRMRAARLDERGITLVELMVATSLFAIIMGGALIGFSGAFRLTRDDRSRSVAANLASQEMDKVRAVAIQNFDLVAIGTTTTTVTVDGTPYTVRRTDAWITNNPNAGPCDGSSQSQAYSEVSVRIRVSWPNMGDTAFVRSQTVLTPPVGTFDPESGNIGVKVFDQTGAGLVGIPVTASPGGHTQVTDVDGCAFIGQLSEGTYTVSLNTSGYVSDQGVQNPSQAVAVTVGTISSIQFNYAQASALDLTLVGKFGGAVPLSGNPDKLGLAYGNTHLLPNGTKACVPNGCSTNTNPRTVSSLYPFVDGYQVWAGRCLDADPQAQKTDGSGAYYPGASRDTPVGVLPGQTSTATVTMATAIITVTKAGVPQVGVSVKALHAVTDSGCTGANTPAFNVGTTDVNGQVTAALPYGTWQFSVNGKTPNGSWPVQVLSPLDTSATLVSAVIL